MRRFRMEPSLLLSYVSERFSSSLFSQSGWDLVLSLNLSALESSYNLSTRLGPSYMRVREHTRLLIRAQDVSSTGEATADKNDKVRVREVA